ncbi:hypothetical protein SAMN05216553_111333 [Lentzea fradiae]|uniref:MazG nucleotide pyrophosphohydrolase domain-containing protein n=1 Tax=Lentzea fradiae TaxID=200378 RepID=A0A1G7X8G7_9PSEU|nr:hypothetical protein [Lentzea fradiae]SDG80461.1 hypothetical protein SAMN05216553_111333 [Lentzea fradiae]
MGEMTRLLADCEVGLRSLQEVQKLYDDDMWEIDDPKFANLRHVHLHLSVTVGKLAKVVEPNDHKSYRSEQVDVPSLGEELSPVLADLVMHAAQIANMLGGDLGRMLVNRYKQNAARFAPDSDFAKID